MSSKVLWISKYANGEIMRQKYTILITAIMLLALVLYFAFIPSNVSPSIIPESDPIKASGKLVDEFALCIKENRFADAVELFNYKERVLKQKYLQDAVAVKSILPIIYVNQYTEYNEINIIQSKGMSARSIMTFIANMIISELGESRERVNEVNVEAYLKAIDPKRLKDFSIESKRVIGILKKKDYLAESMNEIFEKFGYDQKIEYKIIYRLGVNRYSGSMTIVAYEDKWLIADLFGILGGGSFLTPLKILK